MTERSATFSTRVPGGNRQALERRPRHAAAPPDETGEETIGAKKWVFALFIVCLLIPGSFFLGGARLTPYRALLLVAFVPLCWKFMRGAAGRMTSVDTLILLYVLSLAMSVLYHEGFGRIDAVIIASVEAICGYLFGRVLVRGQLDYRIFFQCFFYGLLFMAPFALVEMGTKINLVSKITGMLMQPFGQSEHPPRLGFHRAQVSFEHPILYGLFCSLGFANAFYIFRDRIPKRIFWMGTCFFTTFSSLSSAPILAMLIQSIMMGWDRMAPTLKSKWMVLAGLGISIFLVLELITPNGAVDFLVSNLTLVPATADYRLMTFEYALNSLWDNPVFGAGKGGDIELPWWHTGSIDNFWLSTAVAYGVPTLLFLIAAILTHLGMVMWAKGLDETAADYRSGHFIAVAGLIFTLTTVHLWGAANVMVMAYLGAGAWLYVPQKEKTPLRRQQPVPDEPTEPMSPSPPVRGGPPPAPSPLPRTAGKTVRPRIRGATGRYGGGRH